MFNHLCLRHFLTGLEKLCFLKIVKVSVLINQIKAKLLPATTAFTKAGNPPQFSLAKGHVPLHSKVTEAKDLGDLLAAC